MVVTRQISTLRQIGAERVITPIDYPTRWGLVEYWNLDEASGVAYPYASTNTLTDNNTVTSSAGKVYSLARQFTAANSESLSVADNAALSGTDVDMWGSAWVYRDSATGILMAIFGKYTGTVATSEWLVYRDSASGLYTLSVVGSVAETLRTSATFGADSTSTWNFLMWYHDSVNNLIGISINGGAFDTAAYTEGLKDTATEFMIGARSAPLRFWDGRIGPVAFGKSPPLGIAALATEIRDRIYNSGTGRPYPWVSS